MQVWAFMLVVTNRILLMVIAKKNKKEQTVGCPVETTLKVIGGRWKVLIIHFLLQNTMRFGELTRSLGSISSRTLSKQLRELEADGVINRKDFAEIPPKVEYSLTSIGKTLEPVLLSMEAWGITVKKGSKAKRSRS
jgi:DNA-binding HxlR family transcriptional regulator